MMTVREMNDVDAWLWNDFTNSIESSYYSHLYEWKYVFEKAYNLETKYLAVFNDSDLISVFPLAIIKYPIKGRFAISLPYLNYAGILSRKDSNNEAIRKLYLEYLGDYGINSYELRTKDPEVFNQVTDECTLVLSLNKDEETLWKDLDAKVRNQIRKGRKNTLKTFWGKNQLAEFYQVYSKNITSLGTPIHSFAFFSSICELFGDKVDILTVKLDRNIVAAMFVFKYKNIISDPWASSLIEYQELCSNMIMYWEAIRFASSNEYDLFDFGRSQINSGTYKFKKQWGAEPIKLFNVFYSGGVIIKKSSVDKYRSPTALLFANLWKKLPFPITKRLGPKLRKYIP